MNETVIKVIAAVFIFAGEALAIYQEMVAARAAKTHGLTWALGLWMLLWMTIAGVLLLAGYYFGYLSLKNIWVITVLSIGAILIVEPILVISMFHETPTTGAWIGLALAVLGIFAAVFF